MPASPTPRHTAFRRAHIQAAAHSWTALQRAALAGTLALALALAAPPAPAGEPSEQARTQFAGAAAERDPAAVSYGCGWAEKRLADPAWRPFLKRVTRACAAIAANPDTRQITQQAYRERAFTAALDRAARGLNALYMEMWRVQLADESKALGTVALSDTGVFLALQHERVFRLADRIVLYYDAGSRTAWLR